MRTEDYANMGFFVRTFWFSVWVKIILAKYIAAWLFAEGSCIVSGLSYNGTDEVTKETKWNGMANVRLRLFESCTKFDHVSCSQFFKLDTKCIGCGAQRLDKLGSSSNAEHVL